MAVSSRAKAEEFPRRPVLVAPAFRLRRSWTLRRGELSISCSPCLGSVPGIYVVHARPTPTWMAGTSPAMTMGKQRGAQLWSAYERLLRKAAPGTRCTREPSKQSPPNRTPDDTGDATHLFLKKINLLRFYGNHDYLRPSRLTAEGRCARSSRHARWGCDGRERSQRLLTRAPTNDRLRT